MKTKIREWLGIDKLEDSVKQNRHDISGLKRANTMRLDRIGQLEVRWENKEYLRYKSEELTNQVNKLIENHKKWLEVNGLLKAKK